MDKQQLEQQIDQFINNEMSPSEQQEFRRILETDSNLKQQVELRMILIEGELIRAEKKARMAMEAPKHIHIYPRVAAACILFVFISMGLYVGNLYRYSPEEICQTYYEVPVIERARGVGISEEVAEYNQQIITAYEQQQYEVITKLCRKKELFIRMDAFPASTRLYISIAFIEQQETAEATPLLLPLADTPYKEEVEWLLLCCYMKTNDRKQALQVVEKIKENNGLYKEKAMLIEKLLKEKKWF